MKTLLGMRFKNYFCAVEVVEFIRLLGQLRVTPSYVKQKTPPKVTLTGFEVRVFLGFPIVLCKFFFACQSFKNVTNLNTIF